MAIFRIGMRVRVISAGNNAALHYLVGAETRITRDGFHRGEDVWCLDDLDGGIYVRKDAADVILAPILLDGLHACDEDFKRDLDRVLQREGVPA